MLLNNNVIKKDKIFTIITNELREKYGIKYRKEKKIKNASQIQHQTVKDIERKFFGTPIDQLELKELQLKNGTIIQIPTFVYDTCERILQYKFTEGLFRKAGSTSRQKDIRTQLESGIPLLENDEHHIIDIANVLKLFFRELPMALIPPGILQDTILRCLLCKTQGDQINALMLSLLLLPSINLNTLAYFMDFLKEISMHSHQNKMTIDNLAIIFTPNLMPILPENVTQRLNSHVRIIKLLIEYSHCIGEIPRGILIKIPVGDHVIGDGGDDDADDNTIIIDNNKVNLNKITDTEKKKKKRRSGSLTRMFNGLRKMVGGAFDSSAEGLDEKSPEHIQQAIPCIHNKSTTKRRLLEAGGSAFSSKKKKDVLALLPNNNQHLLPNTPMSQKTIKKSRLILMGKATQIKKSNKKTENASSNVRAGDGNHSINDNKRWSVISSNWTRRKLTVDDSMQDKSDQESSLVSSSLLSSSSSLIATTTTSASIGENQNNNDMGNVKINNKSSIGDDEDGDDKIKKEKHHSNEENYVRISKMEYEAIKERVSAIESRISQEFCNVEAKLSTHNKIMHHAMDTDLYHTLNGPEKVLNKYEQTLEEVEAINTTPSTERLAKRLSRNLKIRRSAEQIIIRSPSARKIGTIRRRSRENLPLIRHQSCNYGNSTVRSSNINGGNYTTELNNINNNNNNNIENVSCSTSSSFYPLKTNLKRGRPNTVQSGLRSSGRSPNKSKSTNADTENEIWTSAEQFFNQNRITDASPLRERSQNIMENNQKFQIQQTPVFISSINMGKIKTPILPPRQLALMKQSSPMTMVMNPTTTMMDTDYHNTPTENPLLKSPKNSSAQKSHQTSNIFNVPTPTAGAVGGRASIAKLRSQNAGMVMAKAKIFSQMENITINNNDNSIPLTRNQRISLTTTTTSSIPLQQQPQQPQQHHQLKSSSSNTVKQTKINRPITNNLNSPKLLIMTNRRIGGNTNNIIGTKKLNCQKVHHKNTALLNPTTEQIVTDAMLSGGQNRSSSETLSKIDNTNMNSNLKILRSDIQNIIKSHLDSPPPPSSTSSSQFQTPNIKKHRRNLNNNMINNSPITVINTTTTTPRIKRPLIVKSPKHLVKTPRSNVKSNKKPSPMRATTPLKLRNSPRLHVQRTMF